MKRPLITGVTGQDGSYLAELPLAKVYEVHGIKRGDPLFDTQRVDRMYPDPHTNNARFKLHYGDLPCSLSLRTYPVLSPRFDPPSGYVLSVMRSSMVRSPFASFSRSLSLPGIGSCRSRFQGCGNGE